MTKRIDRRRLANVPNAEEARVERSPGSEDEDSLALRLQEKGGSDAVLRYRLRQQEILSEFGLAALQSWDVDAMLVEAARLCAEGLHVGFSKVLEYRVGSNDLLLRAGVGWPPDVVGSAVFATDLKSPAGYALKTGKPVISNHLGNEERFRTPALLAEHGVMRAMNVLIVTTRGPWGVLEVDSRDEGRFEVADVAFLQGFANLLGVAIDRQAAEEALKEAIAYQKLLVLETSHRVKNSLALVSALLRLQARDAASQEAIEALEEAASRITAVSEAHNQIWRADGGEAVDLRDFLPELCRRLQAQSPDVRLSWSAQSIRIPGGQAVAAGLFFTELITNAMKHAYPGGSGAVEARAAGENGTVVLQVSDNGQGLRVGFDFEAASRGSLGMKMLRSLASQLNGRLSLAPNEGGGTVGRLEVTDENWIIAEE